jgi:hypothetical protein
MGAISKQYSLLNTEDTQLSAPKDQSYEETRSSGPAQILPFKRIWTKNVVLTLVTAAFFDFHLGYISSLYICPCLSSLQFQSFATYITDPIL